MATEFSTEFDGTDGATANVATENPSGASINALTNRSGTNPWLYETSAKVSGTASVWNQNQAANPVNTSTWTYSHADATTHYYDVCWRVTALPAASTIIFQIRDGGTNKAQVTLSPDGTIVLRNGTTAVDQTASGFCVAGQWVRIQWGITGITQTLRLWTSATTADLLTGTTNDVLTGGYNQSPAAWNQFRMGVMSAQDCTIWLDRLVVDNSTWPASGGSNSPPTANAGPDQTSGLEGGDTVTLNGTGSSDSDGTIVSYLWNQSAGDTVTLSSTTVASPTFTAPATAGSATFQLRVTDDDGAQSTPDTVVISWSAAPTAVPTSDFYELFNFATSGTVNESNTDLDNVTSTVWTYTTAIGDGTGAATATGNGSVKILTHDVSATGSIYMDAIFQIDALPTGGEWYLMRVLSGSTLQATVRVNTNGTIITRNAASTSGQTATSAAITAGEPFRVAWHLDNGAGTQTVRLFTGGNLYGTSPTSTGGGTYNQGTFDHCGFGIAQPAISTGTVIVDTIQVDASDWPAPFGGTVEYVTSEIYLIGGTSGSPTYTPMALDILT